MACCVSQARHWIASQQPVAVVSNLEHQVEVYHPLAKLEQGRH